MRLLREPLLHFVLIGLAFFVWFGAAGDPVATPTAPERIVITDARLGQLSDRFEAVWRRQPTEAELEGLVQDYIREEVYYREALALGLDRDDAVIRQRLRQKMEFLTDAGSEQLEPAPGELEDFLARNAARFTPLPRVSFSQVFLGETADDAETVLAALRDGADPSALGRATLLPEVLEDAPAPGVDGTFGAGFFDALTDAGTGTWTGPVRSAYGLHLVRVDAFAAPPVPDLAEIRGEVLAEWRREEGARIAEDRYQTLLDAYEVVLPNDAALTQ